MSLKGVKNKFMKKSRLLVTIVFMASLIIRQAFALDFYRIPDNFSILDNSIRIENLNDMEEYSITYRNLQEYYGPENFSSSAVQKIEDIKSEYSPNENYIRYIYSDGYNLIIPNAVSLLYGNSDYEKYEQLIYYFEDTEYPNNFDEPLFMSKEKAIDLCLEKLKELSINNLIPDRVLPLTHSVISDCTSKMLTYYSSDLIQYFHNIDESTEAYYISFQYDFCQTTVVGAKQAEFIVTCNGICMLKLYHITEQVQADRVINAHCSIEDALNKFIVENSQQKSDFDSYIIYNISIDYYPEYNGNSSSLSARLIPCWNIQSKCRMKFSGKTKEINISQLYSMEDGKCYYD